MLKAKSRSMMRGAAQNDRQPITKQERRLFKKTVISSLELVHFSHGAKTRDALLDELEPVVGIMAKNGFRAPKDVARLLNKQGWRTACDQPWNPQLAWFLLDFLFRRREQRRKQGPQSAPAPRPKPVAQPPMISTTPLSREEMAQRLAAIGRVTGPQGDAERASRGSDERTSDASD